MQYDVTIIGSGIVGSLLAYDLSKYDINVLLLEKDNDIANGTTMANSAIVHTGYDPKDGTLKAELNVKGARLYKDLCAKLKCEYQVIGAYIVSTSEEESETLDELARRAKDRGVAYEFMDGDTARKIEPNLSDGVERVLSFPETAIIYPWEVAINAVTVGVKNGVTFKRNQECQRIEKTEDGFEVFTQDNSYKTKLIINCAGVHVEQVDRLVTDNPGVKITPKKGEYYVLDKTIKYVDHIIFPVPSKKGKGVLAVPTVHGNTLIGPTSEPIEDKEDLGISAEGLRSVQDQIQKTLKNVPYHGVIRSFAGLRASEEKGDFVLEELSDVEGFYHAAGIDSPGLASAPAIANYIIDNYISKKFDLVEKKDVVEEMDDVICMAKVDEDKRNELIKQNPLYGKIICRCEQISEQEIIDCIKGPCGARSVKAVKKRVRPGMGRCQGGFCEPQVATILARELNIPITEVVYDSLDSKILEKENR